MDKFILEQDPFTQQTQYFVWDDDNDTFHIEYEQNCDDLLAFNRHLYDHAEGGFGDMKKVGTIPMNLYYDLKQKGILDDQKAFKKWLNDRDNRYFRTFPGVV